VLDLHNVRVLDLEEVRLPADQKPVTSECSTWRKCVFPPTSTKKNAEKRPA